MKNKLRKYIMVLFAALLLCSNASRAADFNKDGHQDILLFDKTTRQFTIWYLNGAVAIGRRAGPTLAPGWNLVDVADINGDGYPDLLLFNPAIRQTQVMYLHDNLFAGSSGGLIFSPNWLPVGEADFDHDNRPDLVTFNRLTGQVELVLQNTPNTIKNHVTLPTIPAGWQIKKIVDANHDGFPDFILYKPTTRQTTVLYLVGVNSARVAVRPTIPDGWVLLDAVDWNKNGSYDYVLYNPATRQLRFMYVNANNALVASQAGPVLPVGLAPALSAAKLCVLSLIPASKTALPGGGSGSFVVGCDADCKWKAVSTVPWISILISPFGTGPDTVLYSVTAGVAREGAIIISDRAYPANTARFTLSQKANATGHWTGTFVTNTGCGNTNSALDVHITQTGAQLTGSFTITALQCWASCISGGPTYANVTGTFTGSVSGQNVTLHAVSNQFYNCGGGPYRLDQVLTGVANASFTHLDASGGGATISLNK